MGVSNLVFVLVLTVAIWFFVRNMAKLRRNIQLGRPIGPRDRKAARWAAMIRLALGQSKMLVRPIPALLHIIVYMGFVIINIEVLEIVIDGIFGTHRVLAFLGPVYNFLIGGFECLALGVIAAVTIFWIRRNSLRLQRFWKPEMRGWPKRDANLILYFELLLMLAFLTMNAADRALQLRGFAHFKPVGSFPVSGFLLPFLRDRSAETLWVLERGAWWFHILGILVFLNYLYYSKHLHILLAFPNTWYAELEPQGQLGNLESVKKEVALMRNPQADLPMEPGESAPPKFGASDIMDLNRVQLMNAYSCTECGRCTNVCPANATGKKLSPRKIVMDTRDRVEAIGQIIDAKGRFEGDGKQLLGDYITPEELWACTACNACVEACPLNIDPLSIIIDMRRYLVMEQSAAPQGLNLMMTHMENNAAPWPFSQQDRLDWRAEAG
ncbi:MAG: (Fe-S)-binding protein [Flavobacteriales bacterium]